MTPVKLPKQPPLWLSYYRAGRLLHGALLLFILESWVYFEMLSRVWGSGNLFWIGFWVWSFMFSFIHIFLVIMDSWSRFQDYKKAKDLFFMYGMRSRLTERFIGSKCQRNAALQAARELGLEDELKSHFSSRGVKWFHYIPYFMVSDPYFMIRKAFWQRTFMEKYYPSKFDYHQLELQGAL